MNPYILHFTLHEFQHIAVCLADSHRMARDRLLSRLPMADINEVTLVQASEIAILSPKTTEEDIELTQLDLDAFLDLTLRPIETSRIENIPFPQA